MSLNVRKGVYEKLNGTPAITSKVKGIHYEQAPTGAAFPYIIFNKQAGTKVRAFQTPEAYKRDVWLVKAVDRSSSSNLADEIADAIDSALDGSTLTVSAKTVVDLYHQGDVQYVEDSGDQQYRHSGAYYGVVLT